MSDDQIKWQMPAREKLLNGLQLLVQRHPKNRIVTIQVALWLQSRRKEQGLLQAQIMATNMTATILEHVREVPEQPVFGKALTFIVKTYQRHQDLTSDLLANELSRGFDDLPGLKTLVSPKAFPLSSSLRMGVYRNCAKMLLAWLSHIQRLITTSMYQTITDKQQRQQEKARIDSMFVKPTDWQSVHSLWANALLVYQQAAETIVPFGRHRGKQLQEVGKREVRWLREKIIDPDMIKEQITQLNIILRRRPNEHSMQKQALRVQHLWQTTTKRRTSLRARFLDQRQPLRADQPKVKLRVLTTREHERLRSQLLEAQEFAQEFASISTAVDVFLEHKFPRYPTVHAIPTTSAEWEERERQYHAALNKLRTPWERTLKSDNIEAELERMERHVREEFQQISAAFNQKLQPLSFTRTIGSWPYKPAFALLFSTEAPATPSNQTVESPPESAGGQKLHYRYLLALCLHGKHAQDHFSPERVGAGLRFINYPETPFVRPPHMSLLFAPIACGLRQEQHHFHEIIEQQRQRQHGHHHTRLEHDPSATLKTSLPESAIGSVTITSAFNHKGHIRFTANLHRSKSVPTIEMYPTAVIGFYEHGDSYRYAVVGFDKAITIQDMFIPADVLPKSNRAAYSENYCYALVVGMIRLAKYYHAYIGIEDARWKRQVHLSHDENRQRFRRPRAKILTILRYKAPLAGVLRPYAVRNIAAKDCACCAILDVDTTRRTGKNQAGVFTCGQCSRTTSILSNGALLVAYRTLDYLTRRTADEAKVVASLTP